MENLIFEILKMAGFIVVLFLCCLWLVKDKRSFYKFRDWGLIPLTALAGFVIYCIGYWEAGTKESLITLVVRSFLSTFHMFFLHSDLLEVRHHMHTNATYMFAFSIIHFAAFLVSFLVVLQLFGKQFLGGTIGMRDIFNNTQTFGDQDSTTEEIKEEIRRLVKEEDKKKPLSDSKIVSLLEQKNMKISRRTVAKYRAQLGIAGTTQRKIHE